MTQIPAIRPAIVDTARAALVALAIGAAAPAAAQTEIVYATDWLAQAEHGGMYQAVATGLYEKYGLDVEIKMGGPQIDNQQLLAAGAIDMGTGSNSFFPLNLVQAGADVRAVMAMFQKDPQVLMSHPRDDVGSIEDMQGMPIMIANSSINTFWVWLQSKYGFTDDQIRPYTFNMAPFLVDDTAIQQGYLSSEPYLVEKEGIEPEVYLLADSGYPSYSSLALAPAALIEESPEVVEGFVKATIEGWVSYLYGDPSPANALIMDDNPDMTEDTIAYGIEKMKEYGILTEGDAATMGIGAMTDERWETFYSVMAENGVYPEDLDYTAAYTLDFVNEGYGLDMME
ncbi:MAG: ABC transporter substrate-binding protein [Azospirillaceae bacterium]